MKKIKICPKCGSTYVRYIMPIGGILGIGVWKCFDCNYSGKFPEIRKDKIKEFRKNNICKGKQ